jgi:hypothetical protein
MGIQIPFLGCALALIGSLGVLTLQTQLPWIFTGSYPALQLAAVTGCVGAAARTATASAPAAATNIAFNIAVSLGLYRVIRSCGGAAKVLV